MINSAGSFYLFERLSAQKNIVFLLAIAAILLFTGLGSSPIYILDEARNAQAAREMMENGEPVVPTFNGELRSQKPPLHYYFMWAAYKIFGTTAAATRFFSAVMGWLTLFITWYFIKRFISEIAAYWASAVLICSTHFIFEFRLAVPDPYLIFFTTAGLFTFYACITEGRWYWFVLSASSLALATLAKGPVSLALPGLAALCWLIWERQWKKIFSWRWLLFALIALVIALPWYIMVDKKTNGTFTRNFFIEQNLNRFGETMEGHGGWFILIPLFVIVGLIPFSMFFAEAVKKRYDYKQHSLVKFSACILIVFVAFYSISATKLPNYPMPVYPFCALLLGCLFQAALRNAGAVKLYPFTMLLIINTLLLIAGFIGLSLDSAVKKESPWALVLIVPVITAGLCLYNRKRGLYLQLKILIVGYFVFNGLFLFGAYPAIYRQNPVAKNLHLLNRHETVYAYKMYNPAFNFYLERPVKILNTLQEVQKLMEVKSNKKIITREQFIGELTSADLIVLARDRDIFENSVTVILGAR